MSTLESSRASLPGRRATVAEPSMLARPSVRFPALLGSGFNYPWHLSDDNLRAAPDGQLVLPRYSVGADIPKDCVMSCAGSHRAYFAHIDSRRFLRPRIIPKTHG
jgi:hypothetical protein